MCPKTFVSRAAPRGQAHAAGRRQFAVDGRDSRLNDELILAKIASSGGRADKTQSERLRRNCPFPRR
jgi:hypothetical protein